MKKNNVTVIGVNYSPEDSAIGLYTTQKAEYLVSKGYNVSIITGFPYYPQWKIRLDYKDKKRWYKEVINEVTVYRYKQYVPSNPSFSKRIIHLLSFTFGNIINLFKIDRPDHVICIVPFTSSILLGWFLKLRYRSKLWIHIQDFEFDAAIDSGLLSSNKSIFIKMILWLERVLLKKADTISTISNGMLKKLNSKVNNRKTYYLTNWLDTSKFRVKTDKTHAHLTSEKFKILYSGNIGAKQDWDFFFKVLDQLQSLSDIEVIVVGEGAEKEKVVEKIKTYDFVKHFNLVPYEELPLLLSSADVHFLFQKSDVIDTVMPSKLLGMMASSKPSIVTGNKDSEVATVYKDSQGGYYFSDNSVDEVVNCIKTLKSDKSLCENLGENAETYVVKNYSKENILDRFILELEK
ncbi:WcaI family glycosyltransferase [Psychroserpens luteolus]|uniref:WcaI family glycosyltransferase n=1 Tax=Psychroserpens luteolus TaxID=2855840 RepID=UPI001E4E040D|nr:WcaI family glycosyltransferase [Psychroserpens luteolus]MCD2258229.1 WcaI family glycosyltransferase [Psychroserpens luteolus]